MKQQKKLSLLEYNIGMLLLETETSETLLPEEKCVFCGNELTSQRSKQFGVCGTCHRRGLSIKLPRTKIHDCDAKYSIRFGYRNTKSGKVQIMFCSRCLHYYTIQPAHEWRLNNQIVQTAIKLKKSLSLRDVVKELKTLYGVTVSYQTIANWEKKICAKHTTSGK